MSSVQMTNSAHDTGVVSVCEKGNCTKELEVQFSSSNSSEPSVGSKNEPPVQTPSRTHADVESERAGEMLEHV